MQVTGNNPLASKRLSIRVSTDGFSFYTPQGQRDFAVKDGESVTEMLKEALRKHSLLTSDYDEVCLLSDYPATRVPLDEFRSEEAQSLYKLTFGEDSAKGLTILYEVLPALEVVEIYAVDADVTTVVREQFPEASIHGFYGQTLLNALTEDRKQGDEGRRLHVSLCGHDLFICSFIDGRLQFANTYPVRAVSERQYFILYVWSQLELNQLTDNCLLYGEDAELQTMLGKYIRHITCV